VQHGQKADIRTQVLGVTGNGLQRCGHGTKENAVDGAISAGSVKTTWK
jgi:hypothetical protein